MAIRVCALAAALAVLGGGFAVASWQRPAGEGSRVERTVRKALRAALVEGNYARACRFATPAARRRLVRGYNSSSGRDYPSCAAILRHEVQSPAHRFWIGRLRDGVVVDVLWVRRGRSRVRVSEDTRRDAADGDLLLKKVDGRWRITGSNRIPLGD